MPVPVVLTLLGNIAGAVLGKVADHLFAPIQRKFKYMCCFDSNITELEAQLETFQRTRQGLQLRVDNDRANVRIIDPNVEAWLRSANEVTSEVEGILTQEKPKVEKGCLNGLCPNLKLRYSLSRKVVKKTEFVDDLRKKVVQYTQISYNPPLPSLETIPSRDFKGFESRWFTMEEIIKSLKHDEINLIGVCGMGGAGKTTMVNEVAKRAKEDNNFDEVAMAVVGQEPNLTNVQACIADMLGLKLGDRDNPIVRSDLLHKRLLQDNKKILVILDDIWAEFDLQRMGIPLGGDNKNLKMLYTSRIQDLWHERRTKKEIPLELLSEDEAWQLFKEKVGDSADAPSLQHIAKQIVKKCGRLPLALVLIGSALSKSKGNHIKETWEDMLYRLNSSSRNKDLSELLETSYKYLEDDEAKRLFLLCCLFKEDESIGIEDLARYAFGLSIFDGIDEITKARHRVVALVSDLKSRYLLQESKYTNYLRECVKVHDVVRDMGISIASRDERALVSHGGLSKWPRKDTYEHYTSISVISEEITELPEGLTCSNLELLLLRCGNLEKVPCHFFDRMGKLKVLEIKIFYGILTFQPLKNLTMLVLEGFCGKLDNVRAIGDLQNLVILSFRYSKIEELPEEIGELVNLRLLDLDATRSLKRIPRGVISRLVCLEELYMLHSGFKNWEEEEEGMENANLGEFKSLSNLNTLEINISSDDITILRAPIIAKLKMYKVLIGGKSGEFIWKGQGKRVLCVYRSTPSPSYPFISLLRSSDGLYLGGEGCNDQVRELLLQDGVDGLQQLKQLEIYDCDTPECLANTMNLFPVLECLGLYSLSYLRQICRGPVPTGSFREITELKVEKCGLLENLFELPMGGCFAQLKILSIKSCIMMKEVFRKQQQEDVPDATKRIEFPELETLDLEDLPSLVGFCGGIDQIDFPKLQSMDLKSLGNLKSLFHNNNNLSSNSSQEDNFGFLSLFPQKVSLPTLEVLKISMLENQETLGQDLLSMSALSKLKKFSVHYCGKLLCVFLSQLVLMLQNLERLTVEGFHLPEVVFELEGVDTKEPNPEILSALKVVKLRDIPKLIYISKGDPIGFKYIQTLKIEGCHSLRYVFAPTVMKSIPQLRELKIQGCEMLSRIVVEENGTGESSVDEVEFPQLEKLKLSDLPSLVSFCRGIDQIKFPKLEYMHLRSVGKFKRLINNNSNLSSNSEQKDNFGFLSLFPHKVSLPNLKVLKISKLENLETLGHDSLSVGSLSKLEEFSVGDCGKLLCVFPSQLVPMLRNLERLTVESCHLLELVFELEGVDTKEPNPEILPALKVVKLRDLPKLIYISKGDPIGFKYIQTLEIEGCHSLRYVFAPTVMKSIPQLCKLKIRGCEMLSRIVAEENGMGESSVDEVNFPQLERLGLQDLPNLVSLFPNVNIALPKSTDSLHNPMQHESLFNEKVAIPSLKYLKLLGLTNVSDLWCSELPSSSFSKLEKLKVIGCTSLRNMFHPTMAGGLLNLKELLIHFCSTLEAVVGKEEEVEGGHERKIDKVEFPQLERLELHDLPNLVSLFPNVNIALPKSTNRLHNPMLPQSLFNEKVVVPSLKYLKLLGLENVSDLWCSELPSSSFSKLEKLEVITCASLRTIFHPSMSGGLVNLKELLIEVCLTLKGVVGKEEDVGGGHGSKIDKTLFPLLEKLKLGSLPNLKRFCNSTHPLELPKLSQMDILFCPSMDAFSSEPVCAPNLTLPGISWNGDLNNAIQFLRKNGYDPMARSMEKPRTFDDVTDKFKPWQVAETQCRLVAIPDSTDGAHKVVRLIYTNSGNGVLALGCNGIIRMWKWGGSQHNPSWMATGSVVPQQWQRASGLAMTNDVTGAKLEEAVPCIALSKEDHYVISACGGVISLFSMTTFKVIKKFMPPPPASTFMAFAPQNYILAAIGMEDSTIRIYSVWFAEAKSTLKGHQKRITGLAFSTILKLLVSSGADAQLCIWSIDTWAMLKSVPIQLPAGKARDCDTRVQFHSGQIRLLVFHETQLAIYDASKMDRICQWVPQDVLPAPISCATYSCDDQLIYVSFCDGNIGLFDADSLTLRCHIVPSVFLSPSLLSGSQAVYPLVVAAHPQQPNQLAIGLTDGSVIVMELPTITGLDGGTASSSNASNQTPGLEEDVDVDEVLDEDVDEDALITNRSRVRTVTMGTNDNEEDFEEKRKKEEEERKKKKGKAPLLDEHEEY